jgi:branched-chain amino acid transport system ATP-binding protein
MTLLRADNLAITFGGVKAVDDVSIEVDHGEFVSLIDPNGAGKTTLIGLLTGRQRSQSGAVWIDGKNMTKAPVHLRARAGLAATHQIVQPFADMTVVENVVLAAGHAITAAPLKALFSVADARARDRARDLLHRLGLTDAADRKASTVPLGYLKRLEIARVLATGPKLAMFDEPLAGLNQSEARQIADLIVSLNRDGLTVLLVEHNLSEVVRVSKRVMVLDNGRMLADGPPLDVMQRADVRAAYLGRQTDTQTEPADA